MAANIDLKHGEMMMAEACSTMSASLLTEQSSIAGFLIGVVEVLKDEYDALKAGDKSLYASHSQGHQFTFSVAVSVDAGGTIDYKSFALDDPGIPSPSVTGTQAGDDYQVTEASANDFNNIVNAWQQKTEQIATSGYTQFDTNASAQTQFVQFSAAANSVLTFGIKLLCSKL